jgi:hypothetical protein
MSTWYDAFGAEYNASNSNYTDQSQSNPTAVAGGSIQSVDVHNNQSNETYQQADAHSGGYEAPSFGSSAANYNETYQSQNNPTVVLGDHIGSVDVDNNQSNETHQHADAHSGGYEAPWFGSSAMNSNETYQSQNNPTVVLGDHIGSVDVHNNQSNETYQQADAHSGGYEAPWFGSSASNFNETHQSQNDPTFVFGGSGGGVGHVDVHNDQSNATLQQADAGSGAHGLFGFPSSGEASNFNFTTQVQANPTIVIGDHIGDVDVHNSQSNVTEQLALAHH